LLKFVIRIRRQKLHMTRLHVPNFPCEMDIVRFETKSLNYFYIGRGSDVLWKFNIIVRKWLTMLHLFFALIMFVWIKYFYTILIFKRLSICFSFSFIIKSIPTFFMDICLFAFINISDSMSHLKHIDRRFCLIFGRLKKRITKNKNGCKFTLYVAIKLSLPDVYSRCRHYTHRLLSSRKFVRLLISLLQIFCLF